jgi:type III pantothenate kinase
MIAPGLKLMASALSHGTAQLPQVSELSTQPADFATDTEAGIINGCVAAHAGAIDYALRELGARFPDQAAPHCVISGGAAPYVVPSLTIPHTVVDNLVLIGLQVMI